MIEGKHFFLQMLIVFKIDYLKLLLSRLVAINPSAMTSMLVSSEVLGNRFGESR